MNWQDSVVMVTGGTGSFGKKFAEILLREYHPKKVVIFSRDELKQHEMRLAGYDHDSMRFFLGDVRDRDRLRRAMSGVDIVVHAAALKQVPACEYNPLEAVKTNALGAASIIEAALDAGVKKVIGLSTDKAVNPANLYGATKLVAEKLFVHGNVYSGLGGCQFSCVRYGNVVGSRGSVVPPFLQQRKKGFVTVTDRQMTRFWMTVEEAARFVIRCAEEMKGGEIFIPKIPSMKIIDLVEAIAPGCEIRTIGIRPGEKLHEVLVAEDEARQGCERDASFVLLPAHPDFAHAEREGVPLPAGFRYTSDTNGRWLSPAELRTILQGHLPND